MKISKMDSDLIYLKSAKQSSGEENFEGLIKTVNLLSERMEVKNNFSL